MRAILDIVLIVLQIYLFVIVAAAAYSWLIAFNIISRYNQMAAAIGDMLYRMTEPALAPIRQRMPNFGTMDLSPIVLILIILFIQRVIVYYIYPNVF